MLEGIEKNNNGKGGGFGMRLTATSGRTTLGYLEQSHDDWDRQVA